MSSAHRLEALERICHHLITLGGRARNVSLSLHGCQRLSLYPGGRVLGSAVTLQMRFILEVVCLRARSFVFYLLLYLFEADLFGFWFLFFIYLLLTFPR